MSNQEDVAPEDDQRMTLMRRECRECRELKTLRVRGKDCQEFNRPDRRHVQDIFPYLSANDRELLISGVCGECFDKMFGEE